MKDHTIQSRLGHWFDKMRPQTQQHHSAQTHAAINGLRRKRGEGSHNERRIWKGVNKDKLRGDSIMYHISSHHQPKRNSAALSLHQNIYFHDIEREREKTIGPDDII